MLLRLQKRSVAERSACSTNPSLPLTSNSVEINQSLSVQRLLYTIILRKIKSAALLAAHHSLLADPTEHHCKECHCTLLLCLLILLFLSLLFILTGLTLFIVEIRIAVRLLLIAVVVIIRLVIIVRAGRRGQLLPLQDTSGWLVSLLLSFRLIVGKTFLLPCCPLALLPLLLRNRRVVADVSVDGPVPRKPVDDPVGRLLLQQLLQVILQHFDDLGEHLFDHLFDVDQCSAETAQTAYETLDHHEACRDSSL